MILNSKMIIAFEISFSMYENTLKLSQWESSFRLPDLNKKQLNPKNNTQSVGRSNMCWELGRGGRHSMCARRKNPIKTD